VLAALPTGEVVLFGDEFESRLYGASGLLAVQRLGLIDVIASPAGIFALRLDESQVPYLSRLEATPGGLVVREEFPAQVTDVRLHATGAGLLVHGSGYVDSVPFLEGLPPGLARHRLSDDAMLQEPLQDGGGGWWLGNRMTKRGQLFWLHSRTGEEREVPGLEACRTERHGRATVAYDKMVLACTRRGFDIVVQVQSEAPHPPELGHFNCRGPIQHDTGIERMLVLEARAAEGRPRIGPGVHEVASGSLAAIVDATPRGTWVAFEDSDGDWFEAFCPPYYWRPPPTYAKSPALGPAVLVLLALGAAGLRRHAR